MPSRLAEQKASTASGKMLKTSTAPHAASSLVVVEQALRRVDRDQAVLVAHDERHRHERAAARARAGRAPGWRRRRRSDPRDPPVDIDDARPDQLVHPERVRVVDRLGVDRRVRVALGRQTVGHLAQRDEPAVLVRAGLLRR